MNRVWNEECFRGSENLARLWELPAWRSEKYHIILIKVLSGNTRNSGRFYFNVVQDGKKFGTRKIKNPSL